MIVPNPTKTPRATEMANRTDKGRGQAAWYLVGWMGNEAGGSGHFNAFNGLFWTHFSRAKRH